MISFTVFGRPQPQGSARAFIPKGWKRPIITSANPKLKSWRQELATAAKFACHKGEIIPRPFAVRVEVCCFFARPKHTNKKIQHKTTKPDADKLLRSVLDGLTGIAFDDDSQVVDARVFKYFGSPERVEIAFEETPYES